MSRSARLRLALPYLVVLGIAFVLMAVAQRIEYSSRPGTIGPQFWPMLVLGVMALVCMSEIVATLFFRRTGAPSGLLEELMQDAEAEGVAAVAPSGARHPWRLAFGVAAAFLYVALIGWVGFFVDTWLFVTGFVIAGGYRRIVSALILGGVSSLAFMYLFMKLVYVSLPLGAGPFHALSVALLGLLGVR